MRRKLFRAALFACLFFRGCTQLAYAQNPDLVLNPGSSYVDIGRGIDWGTQFNRTYVFVPNSPNASVCIYVVNNNATSAHTFTAQTFQSADSSVGNYSSNTGRFSAVPLVSMPASVPAAQMVSGFTQSTAAAKVAIKFSGATTQAGSPDTADIFLVQTTSGTCGSASTATFVQGTTAVGAAVTGNPFLIGGKDLSGNAQFYMIAKSGDAPGSNYDSMPIGALGGSSAGIGSSTAVQTLPKGSPAGPLAVAPSGVRASSGASMTNFFVGDGSSASAAANAPGQFTTNSGFFKSATGLTINSTGQNIAVFTPPGTGVYTACYVTIDLTNTAGTTPTIDSYFQTANDGANWTDRIHFAQLTTGTQHQYAGISNVAGGIVPANTQDRALGVSLKVDGPIGFFGRFVFVVTGTTPSYTVGYGVACS